MAIRIIVVEDDDVVRKSTVSLLNAFGDLECVAAAASAEEFVRLAPAVDADLALMDIGLPGQNGIECVRSMRPQHPNLLFMMFTSHNSWEEVFQALIAGAKGYVLKDDPPARLRQDILDVTQRRSPMSGQIAALVLEFIARAEAAMNSSSIDNLPGVWLLTPREREVAQYLREGLTDKEIAVRLNIAHNTVRTHVRNIYDKLEGYRRPRL